MFLVTAFLFGLTLAAAVGPIALLIMNTGMTAGPAAGLRAGLGAALADLCYAAVALTAGGALAATLAAHDAALRLAAAAVLTGFGLWMLRGALVGGEAAARRPPPAMARHPLLATFALTVVNPLTVLLFLGFTAHLPPSPGPGTVALATLAVFAGSAVVQAAFALGGAGLGRLLRDGPWVRRLNIASALGVTLFGVAGLAG